MNLLHGAASRGVDDLRDREFLRFAFDFASYRVPLKSYEPLDELLVRLLRRSAGSSFPGQ